MVKASQRRGGNRALRHKLLRDLWVNRMQMLAVVLLCALGTWIFSGLDAAWRMIDLSSQTYFHNQQLADLWITLPRVERDTLSRMRAIPGMEDVQARASAEAEVKLPHEPELLVTAFDGQIRINTPLMYEGETLHPNDERGCLLDDGFAKANGYEVGDRLKMEIGGREYGFIVRGTCLSAEYVALSKNGLHDSNKYGFVLVNHCAVPLLPLSSVTVRLEEAADGAQVEAAVRKHWPEALIVNHGAHSATYGIRKDVDMFRSLSYLFPLMAYAVAAMIVLTTVTRMLENQRMQMGTLKALGYRDGQMLSHYMSYAFYPSLIGSLIGLVVGRYSLPYILWSLEEAQFTMPYQLQAPVSAAQWAVCALGVALSCAICFHTYRKSAREVTAALLRPKPPKAGRKLMLERIPAIWHRMGFNSKMIVRNLFRNKARTLMMFMGVLCCNSLVIASLGLTDSVNYFVDKYYAGTVQYSLRANLTGSIDSAGAYARRIEAERVEGVMELSVSIRSASTDRSTTLSVMQDGQRLMNLGEDETWVPMPERGVMLTQKLAETLGVSIGDPVELWLAGDDEPIRTSVTDIAYLTLGKNAMMSQSAWESERKGAFVPTALLVLNPTERGRRQIDELDQLKEVLDPAEQRVDMLRVLDSLSQIFSLMFFAALGLAFVVLYNMGLLNYAERYREYATLKVLGYHQKEIRRLIRAENDLITFAGIALSLWPGWWLTGAVMTSCESDSMVFAFTVKPVSFVIACVVTWLFSEMITALLTRKVKNVDMVEALKSVE